MFKTKRVKELEEEVKLCKVGIIKLAEIFTDEQCNKVIKDYKETPYKNCPFYIQEVFKKLHRFYENFEDDTICMIKDNLKKEIVGNRSQTLLELIESYVLISEYRGKMTLSCPRCQEVFALECSMSEDYTHICEKCGKRIKVKVTSNQVNIVVK